MLGRKNYTPQELRHAKTAIDRQLTAYKKLVKAVEATSDPEALAALEAFEPLFFNNMAPCPGPLLRPPVAHRRGEGRQCVERGRAYLGVVDEQRR